MLQPILINELLIALQRASIGIQLQSAKLQVNICIMHMLSNIQHKVFIYRLYFVGRVSVRVKVRADRQCVVRGKHSRPIVLGLGFGLG